MYHVETGARKISYLLLGAEEAVMKRNRQTSQTPDLVQVALALLLVDLAAVLRRAVQVSIRIATEEGAYNGVFADEYPGYGPYLDRYTLA